MRDYGNLDEDKYLKESIPLTHVNVSWQFGIMLPTSKMYEPIFINKWVFILFLINKRYEGRVKVWLFYMGATIIMSYLLGLRAIILGCVNLCKIEKCSLFTHFGSKNTHISWGNIVHLCTITTVIVHICTATVVFAYHILVFFFLSHPLFFSLSPLTLTTFIFSHLIPLASTIADRHQSLVADQHHATTADQHHTTCRLIKSPPITLPSLSVFFIWSRSNHCCTKPDQIVTGQLTDFLLFDRWVSSWVGFWSWVGLILSGSPIG